ncbi:MAG: hypothetical protein ACM3S1_03425 [Hyphomicrobiales bacterium]
MAKSGGTTLSAKAEALRLVESLDEDATWDDLAAVAEALALRAKIERGLEESRAGETVPHEQVMRELGIEP